MASSEPSRGGLEVERWSDNRLDSALVGSNPIYVWCINPSVAKRLCCKFQCRTPGPLMRVYNTPIWSGPIQGA